MSKDFKWLHYRGEVTLWAVRWYCRYGISYRELKEMLEDRGVDALVPCGHQTGRYNRLLPFANAQDKGGENLSRVWPAKKMVAFFNISLLSYDLGKV